MVQHKGLYEAKHHETHNSIYYVCRHSSLTTIFFHLKPFKPLNPLKLFKPLKPLKPLKPFKPTQTFQTTQTLYLSFSESLAVSRSC